MNRRKRELPPEVHFHNPSLAALGVEPMSLAELRRRAAAGVPLGRIERAQFFMVLLITAGQGEHLIDFAPRPVAAQSVVVVRPGEVHQWRLREGLEGELVLLDPAVLFPLSRSAAPAPHKLIRLDDWPGHFRIPAALQEDWSRLFAVLGRLVADSTRDALQVATVRELFLCMLLALSRHALGAQQTPDAAGRLYRRFLRELDARLHTRPSVATLAGRLGVSPLTLSRACLRETGRPAKQVIDHRVALEAQRLLVHSSTSAADIAARLGFSEATNFHKFFRRTVGEAAEAFRSRHLQDLPGADAGTGADTGPVSGAGSSPA